MIEIQLTYGPDVEHPMAIEVSGHAGFEGPDGGDIVCSAVSALVGYLGIAFSQVLNEKVSLDAGDGLFRFSVLEPVGDSAATVLVTWDKAIRELAQGYSDWVRITEIKR